MAKINLNVLEEDKQLAILSKYHKHVYKSSLYDPIITTRRIRKRFIVSTETCEYLLNKLIERDNRLSPYIELGFI